MSSADRIRIGRHYPIDSPVHRLDARVKLAGALALMVTAFIIPSGYGLVLELAGLLLVILAAKLPPFDILRGLRTVLVLLVIAGSLQLLFAQGRVLWQVGPFDITNTGVANGVYFPLRIILMAVAMSLLTLTTTPLEMLDGLEAAARPLARLRLPAFELALVLSISLRFLPTVLSLAGDIKKAQASRGADFDSRDPIRRSRAVLPLLVPLFAAGFRDAEQLARAMSARGYRGGERRGHYRVYRLGARDAAALLLVAGLLAGCLLIR
ncbi:MAG: energy-coupling factor transporter transmembrane component T family protein [Candidatus Geothermincolia bacterium]